MNKPEPYYKDTKLGEALRELRNYYASVGYERTPEEACYIARNISTSLQVSIIDAAKWLATGDCPETINTLYVFYAQHGMERTPCELWYIIERVYKQFGFTIGGCVTYLMANPRRIDKYE